MENKCRGCGAIIQTTNPQEVGFIRKDVLEKKPDSYLCERCFKLKHYNELIKTTIKEEEFLENIKSINNPNALIINIVDCFDLEGTIIPNINNLFPNNPILIIGNKYDLFLRSNRPTKIKKYINWYLESINVRTNGVIITSSKDSKGIDKLYNSLLTICEALKINKEIYFFGVTNVGKSSLIRAIINAVGNDEDKVHANNLVISNTIGTTLGFNQLQVGDLIIYDTPGICNSRQITYYLDKDTLDFALPIKFVKPKSFQLNSHQTIFVEGFGWFSYFGDRKCTMVTYFSNRLTLHRTKSNHAEEFFNQHKDDIFRYPNPEERIRLGDLVTITFDNVTDCEISLSGIGFISFYGQGNIELTTYKNIGVSRRKQLI